MEVLKFIAIFLLVVILACFAIFASSLVVFIIHQMIDDWRWNRRRK